MDDAVNLGNIQSPCCQIGTDQERVTAIFELKECLFPLFLLHPPMEDAMRYLVVIQQVTDAVDRFPVVAKNKCGFITKVTKQGKQSVGFISCQGGDCFYRQLRNMFFSFQKIKGGGIVCQTSKSGDGL